MQLPVRGHPLHTRSLTMVVTLRDDGCWHARGDVLDLRKTGFVPMISDIQPAGIVHNMSLDLRIDPSTSRIESVEVAQPVVAVEPSSSSRGECCRDPVARLSAMEGECLDGSFARSLGKAFGGPLGCSHLLTLFQLMASGLRRAIPLESALTSAQASRAERKPGDRLFWRSVFVEGFDSEAEEGAIEMVVQLADFHTRPLEPDVSLMLRLARQSDVRLFARAAGSERRLSALQVADRERSAESLATAQWRDRSARLADLVGVPLVGGLAGRLFAILDRPEDQLLLDTALQLAPGYIQVIAAMMDRWLVQPKQGAPARDASGQGGRDWAEVGHVGGLPDSCYMWRSDGPLSSLRSVRREK